MGQRAKINKFRDSALAIQQLLIDNSISEAIARLDMLIESMGWTLWAGELRCALEQVRSGTEAQKSWSTKLQNEGSNRVSGLLSHIVSERNEDGFSYDSFYSKCKDSFPRLKTNANWLPRYLLYRAIAHVDDARATFTSVLARESTSSLIDYYEALVDALRCIADGKAFRDLRPQALSMVQRLIEDGFTDHRLRKLALAFGGPPSAEYLQENLLPITFVQFSDIIAGRISSDQHNSFAGLPENIPLLLKQASQDGVVASSSIASLLKIGVNFKALDAGLAIGMASQHGMSDLLSLRAVSIESAMFSPTLHPEDVVGMPDGSGRSIIHWLSENHPDAYIAEKCRRLHRIVEGDAVSHDWDTPGVLHLWLGRQLIVAGRYDDAVLLSQELQGINEYWLRQSAKLKLWAMIKKHDLVGAVNLAATWILKDPLYTVELPIQAIFENRDWSQFRDIDPKLVALVSHHTNVVYGDPKVGYICKMACRRFAMSGERGIINAGFESATDTEWKTLVVVFLRDVWIEENLSMNHLLDSTDAVIEERMDVYQHLLTWDAENEQDYIDAIKDLTLDQTLRKGLRHIDETRVFVNEPAITRWAEKELAQDFDRWAATAESSPDARMDDELMRQYFVDPNYEAFLREMSDGNPTEADVLLANIFERLFRRFLTDPTDGLDCFLSLRIRHGSLRGTLFGPLEEQGLLYSSSQFSRAAFEERWADIVTLNDEEKDQVLALLEQFAIRLRAISDEVVNDTVQIRSTEKPSGAIAQYVVPISGPVLQASLKGQAVTFPMFAYSAYFLFWQFIELGLNDLATYVRTSVKERVQEEFDRVVEALRQATPRAVPLLTALTAVATTTQSQCDVIAGWFQAPRQALDDKYKLSAAIEIARTSAKKVHRAFPAEISVTYSPEEDPPLGAGALSVLSDSLFVIFENAWKYSGLASDIGQLDVSVQVDKPNQLLTLRVENNLDETVLTSLENGQLDELKERYLSKSTVERTSREGGSGFAKLSRMSRYVDRGVCPMPLDFGVSSGRWYTVVTIPLVERNDVYETY